MPWQNIYLPDNAMILVCDNIVALDKPAAGADFSYILTRLSQA